MLEIQSYIYSQLVIIHPAIVFLACDCSCSLFIIFRAKISILLRRLKKIETGKTGKPYIVNRVFYVRSELTNIPVCKIDKNYWMCYYFDTPHRVSNTIPTEKLIPYCKCAFKISPKRKRRTTDIYTLNTPCLKTHLCFWAFSHQSIYNWNCVHKLLL